jgi:hypothetical protein
MFPALLPAPVEFPLHKIQEFSRCSWSAYFLDLAQRVAQLLKVLGRDQGPLSKVVEYPLAAPGPDVFAHAAALESGPRRNPWWPDD